MALPFSPQAGELFPWGFPANRLHQEFETCRPRDRQISVEYDPDNDDYQIQVIPEVPEEIALMEEQLIKKQVAKLQIRMDQGG